MAGVGTSNEPRGPVNTCDFRIGMEIMHEGGHFLKVKYDWINIGQAADGSKEITYPVIDAGLLKDWNLL